MKTAKELTLTITTEDLGNRRLDIYLVNALKQLDIELSREQIKNYFRQGLITAERKLELKRLPPAGTIIHINLPAPKETSLQAEDIPLDILFEDEHLIIINKPAGMVTHPAPGNYSGTLVNAILHHCKDLQGVGDQLRPGIVHRLDKGTSGVMVVAKHQVCHNRLTKMFSRHDLIRKYEALIVGTKNSPYGRLDAPIGRDPRNRLKMAINEKNGKEAITNYKVLQEFTLLTHMELTLETGRTHQIRVHLSSLLRKPIFMDPLYGNPKQHLLRVDKSIAIRAKDYPYPFLHAKHLAFTHPMTKEELSFTTSPPEIFKDILGVLYDN